MFLFFYTLDHFAFKEQFLQNITQTPLCLQKINFQILVQKPVFKL